MIYDQLKPLIVFPHEDEVNCIKFNPLNSNILASADKNLSIFDLVR